MHYYSCDNNRLVYVSLVIGLLSVLLARLLGWTLDRWDLQVPWYVDDPSIFGFFAILFSAFEFWLWRTRLGQSLLGHCHKNYAGRYEGEVENLSGNHQGTYPATMVIEQTYTRLRILLTVRGSSTSRSFTAGITHEGMRPRLNYLYLNLRAAGAADDMKSHHGAAWLEQSDNPEEIEGEYFTGHERRSYGRMHFRRSNR